MISVKALLRYVYGANWEMYRSTIKEYEYRVGYKEYFIIPNCTVFSSVEPCAYEYANAEIIDEEFGEHLRRLNLHYSEHYGLELDQKLPNKIAGELAETLDYLNDYMCLDDGRTSNIEIEWTNDYIESNIAHDIKHECGIEFDTEYIKECLDNSYFEMYLEFDNLIYDVRDLAQHLISSQLPKIG